MDCGRNTTSDFMKYRDNKKAERDFTTTLRANLNNQ